MCVYGVRAAAERTASPEHLHRPAYMFIPSTRRHAHLFLLLYEVLLLGTNHTARAANS
jgi:hypothetical protein